MQISRLFEIVYTLLDKRQVTTGELADRFGVSKRTIMRDLDALTVAGIPIRTTVGNGGGVSLAEDFVLNKETLSETEQKKILFALQSVAGTNNVDVQAALEKLTTFFSKPNTGWIEIDFSRWETALADRDKFDTIKDAILEAKILAFTYVNTEGLSLARTVCPLKFVLKSNAWYLQAYCLVKNDYRTFKLNRMLDVRKTSESFDTDRYAAPPITVAKPHNVPLVSLVLQFTPKVAYRVYDEFLPTCIEKQPDGSTIVRADLPEDDDWLYRYLLTFGADARVLQPTRVRDELLKCVKEIEEIYQR